MLNLINLANTFGIKIIVLYIGSTITKLGQDAQRMSGKNKKKACCGQVLLEYGIVLALVATALVGLQLYVQRGLQARYKDAADAAIEEIRQAKGNTRSPLQYEPYYQRSDITVKKDSKVTRSYSAKGVSTTEIDHDKAKVLSGWHKVLPYSSGVEE